MIEAELPDGTVIEFPAGTTPDVIQRTVKNMAVRAKPAPMPTYDPTEGMSTFDKVAAGIGKAGYDTARGIGQMFGMVSPEDVAESRKRDAALMNTGAGMTGNILGNVGLALPSMMLPGVNTVMGGAAVGAGLAALQPTTKEESRLKNMGVGAVFGGAVPAAVGAFKAGKAALFDPIAGQNKIIGGALARSAGDKPQEIIKALRGAGAATPGVKLSAGQTGQSEGLSALEDAITSQIPSGELARMGGSNRAALADALRGVAGTPEDMAAAIAKRESTAGSLYNQARNEGIDPALLTPEVQANLASLQQRIPENIINEARKLAKISGVDITDDAGIQGLHWTKKAIDGEIGAASRAGNSELKRELQGLQQDFINGIGQISPKYDAGRKAFTELSTPINQMQVGESLANKLIPPTSGDIPAALNYATLARSMRDPDQVAKTATGFSGAKMANILSPEQMGTVQGVTSDASRMAEALRRGMGNGPATARRIVGGQMLSQHFAQEAPFTSKILELASAVPGLGATGRVASGVASLVGDKFQAQMLGKMDDMLANNPQEVARLIEAELSRLAPSQQKQILQALPQSVVMSLPASYGAQK